MCPDCEIGVLHNEECVPCACAMGKPARLKIGGAGPRWSVARVPILSHPDFAYQKNKLWLRIDTRRFHSCLLHCYSQLPSFQLSVDRPQVSDFISLWEWVTDSTLASYYLVPTMASCRSVSLAQWSGYPQWRLCPSQWYWWRWQWSILQHWQKWLLQTCRSPKCDHSSGRVVLP